MSASHRNRVIRVGLRCGLVVVGHRDKGKQRSCKRDGWMGRNQGSGYGDQLWPCPCDSRLGILVLDLNW